mgnify:CR=1 FL=1
MSDGSGYELVLSFAGLDFGANAEHAFVHGFEAGQIWQRMMAGREAEIDLTCHAANRVLLERAAASQGWALEIDELPDCGGTYIHVKLAKKTAPRGNPHGLRIAT